MNIPEEIKDTHPIKEELAKNSSSEAPLDAAEEARNFVFNEIEVFNPPRNIEIMSSYSKDSDRDTAYSVSDTEIMNTEPLRTILCVTDAKDRQIRQVIGNEFPQGVGESVVSDTATYCSDGTDLINAEEDLIKDSEDLISHQNFDFYTASDMDIDLNEQSSSILEIADEYNNISAEENPWSFLDCNGIGPSPLMITEQPITSMLSVGVQVYNPEDQFLCSRRRSQLDAINCMMCAVIIAGIITGLFAVSLVFVSIYFPDWLR